jgi:hypothetical protein
MAGDYEIPGEWYSQEVSLFVDLLSGDPEGFGDTYLQRLFDMAMFEEDISRDDREDAYQAMVDYLWSEYGIDFEDAFDWEDYRAWYDTQ